MQQQLQEMEVSDILEEEVPLVKLGTVMVTLVFLLLLSSNYDAHSSLQTFSAASISRFIAILLALQQVRCKKRNL